MKALIITMLMLSLLAGCVNTSRNFKSAGFQSKEEAKKYVKDYLYYANKLTDEEWDAFYQRFPEYWKDIQYAKMLGGTLEYHPWYTAYAFKWSSDRRKGKLSDETLMRLDKHLLEEGDTIYKVVYAKGVPSRVIWDNDFEILLYKSGEAIIFKNRVFHESKKCLGCSVGYDESAEEGMDVGDVIGILGLVRPEY